MKNILIEISEKAIKYEDFNFTLEQTERNWLGTIPAAENAIAEAERRLGVLFPDDYKAFLRITNGFSAANDVEPSFERIEDVDYLNNVFDYIVDDYSIPELANAIIVAGKSEEQYFLLLPPAFETGKWNYWKFAHWYPGEQPFQNLNEYFEDVLRFIVETHER